ncbi:COG4223 family protein [Roseibium sp.]|uniref:COG4223 family protein n=1 Tax=Roseibium sp. TaxID=1936156 RepID=UPI003A983C8E
MSTELQDVLGRISGVESRLGELAETSSGADAASRIDALETRIGALAETAEAAGTEALERDIEGLKSSYQMLAAKFGAITTDGGSVDEEALSGLEQRLASAEAAAAKTSGFEDTLGSLSSEVSDFTKRLENVEATAKAAQTAVSTSDVSLKTLADSQARASETLATLSADIRSSAEKQAADLTKVREELESLSKRLAAVEATMGDATAREIAARALSVSALKSAVDSGRAYETELAAVRAGLPKDTDLAALEAHAKTGVAPVSVLIAEFPPIARSMFAEFSQPERGGDMLDSLLAGAKSIIAVRGPGDESGTGPEAVLRRMENAVARGDLGAGLDAYANLPDAAKTVGADWAERARARVAIDALTEKASSEVLSALSRRDS